ncbi:MAG: GGDEF domain-containing protein [Acidobacteriota bacterium]
MKDDDFKREDILEDLFTAKVVARISQKIEQEDFFEEFLFYARRLSNAKAGFAYILDDPKSLTLIATTIAQDSHLYEAFSKLDYETMMRILGVEAKILGSSEILSPFSALIAEYGSLDMLFIPLFAKREIFGALFLLREPGGSAKYFEKVTMLMEEVKPALENIATVRSLRELIIRDDTVDCFNRRYFDSQIMDEISRATRFSLPLSLVFFDIDNLKEVNSLYSHSAGSRMLFEIALRVKGGIRKIDKLCRYGGDEFCVILPETDVNGSIEVAERLRDLISRKPFLVSDTGGIKMTASFGVASFPLHADTKEELIIQADKAMQRIKVLGKNSISIADNIKG